MKTIEDKIAFANKINFSELFRHAEVFSGMVLTFTEPQARDIRGTVVIDFQSSDVSSSCGVFGKILESCIIAPFSNSVFEDKETGELAYWVKMNVQYQHMDGGSNGMELFTAWYRDGKWQFKNVGQAR